MTKKHFEAIARIIRWRFGYNFSSIDYDAGYNRGVWDVTHDLADFLELENPRFNRAQFLTACGLDAKVTP